MDEVTDPTPLPPRSAGQRGPAEHGRREQIIRAADQHIRQFGYRRTSVADLARAIGFSPSYVYKFFESKRAIGEAICAMCLREIDETLWSIANGPGSAEVRLGNVYRSLVEQGRTLYFTERKLHDIVSVSVEEKWNAVEEHREAMKQVIRKLVVDGREAGEFERKTPIDEVCRAIGNTMAPFSHPALLEKELDHLDENVGAVARLVLRSLAP